MTSNDPPLQHSSLVRSRETLPSINTLGIHKHSLDSQDSLRYHSTPTISTHAPSVIASSPPTTARLGPPSSQPLSASVHYGSSRAISPPPIPRGPVRDARSSSTSIAPLPPLSEAFDLSVNRSAMPLSGVLGDAPKGPGNPFSQHAHSAVVSKPAPFLSNHGPIEPSTSTSSLPPPPPPPPSQQAPPLLPLSADRYGPVTHRSPRMRTATFSTPNYGSTGPGMKREVSMPPSPYGHDHRRETLQFVDCVPNPHQRRPSSPVVSPLDPRSKPEPQRSSFKALATSPYSDTVKRHLDLYEAEVAISEFAQASARASEVSKSWAHRFHQLPPSDHFPGGLPDPAEVEDAIRSMQHVLGQLSRLRDTTLLQQNLIQEHRMRNTRRIEDLYPDDQGYDGSEKKRRGKAAPPGRCHSCNRAETPEWRRGPDGARTLCNACGLHYAKLTRKVGATKAASLTGSSLRPKTLQEARV